jgi:membrane protein
MTLFALFALVPMLTVMYSMFSLVPVFQGVGAQVEAWVYANFLPSSGREISVYLREFSSQALSLSGLGVAMLMLTAYLMLMSIEVTFNAIWATSGARRGLNGFLVYWAILSLTPVLLASAFIMKTYLLSFNLLVNEIEALGALGSVFSYLPGLMTWMAFSLLFFAVPNCRVRLRYALWGGLVTSLMLILVKWLFALIMTHSSYTTVYGAFALIPLLLMWVYLLWFLILLGAVWVCCLQTFVRRRSPQRLPAPLVNLMILWRCRQLQNRGELLSDTAVSALGIEVQQWQGLRTELLRRRVLEQTLTGDYALLIDLHNLAVVDVFSWGDDNLLVSDQECHIERLSGEPWCDRYRALAIALETSRREHLSGTVMQLFADQEQQTV